MASRPPLPPDAETDNPDAPWGLRADGKPKGRGWLGVLRRPDGDISTELAVGANFDGVPMDIPLLVPGLHRTEIEWLLKVPGGGGPKPKVPDSIRLKAEDHAKKQLRAGKSPFYEGFW